MSKTIELTDEQWQALQSGEDVTLKAPAQKFEYPIYAKNKHSNVVVRFDGLTSGEVMEKGNSGFDMGYYRTAWNAHSGKYDWEILPDYQEEPEKWEPKGVPVDETYYFCDEQLEIQIDTNNDIEFDRCCRNAANMSKKRWQAEEIAKHNRANNRISQYVFEHMKEGEVRDRIVTIGTTNGKWGIAFWTAPTEVPMPERVAKMLCDDLTSGRVEL